jgi:imidazolonepropionase-like amidohydrolase
MTKRCWGLVATFLSLMPFATGAVTVIEADAYLDVVRGELIRPAVIVIDGEHIVTVNPDDIPDGADIVDLGGHILLPGLIDVHTHLTMDISAGWRERAVRDTAGDRALRGARNAKRTIEAGFTTVRDVGGRQFADIALARAIDEGFVPGPRMIPSAHSLSITGGHCDTTGFAPGIGERDFRSGVADGVDELLKAVRYQIKHGAKVIKICATAGVLSSEGPAGAQQYSDEELRAAVEETHRHGLKIAAHAHGTEGIKAAVRAGVDSVEHGSLLDDEAIILFKENGTYLVMNIYPPGVVKMDTLSAHNRAKAEYIFPRREKSFQQALKAGLKLPFGTDAAVYPHGLNAQQFAVKVGLGQDPADAIRSATVLAAELLGKDDRGSIQAGLLADLIAVDGNPLEDVRELEDVRFVMKGGDIIVGIQ